NGGPVSINLIQEGSRISEMLGGLYDMRGIVVRGLRDPLARMVMESNEYGEVIQQSRATAPLNGLNVKGYGMILVDSFVRASCVGSKWRVAVVMHREWDSQDCMLQEFEIDYLYDKADFPGKSPGDIGAGTVARLEGNVVNLAGTRGKWIVDLISCDAKN
ncbi:hypothetical protein DFH28DRAFT_888070, partial [Melampsora americana]